MSESECKFKGMLRHKYTVEHSFLPIYCRFSEMSDGRIDETPLY